MAKNKTKKKKTAKKKNKPKAISAKSTATVTRAISVPEKKRVPARVEQKGPGLFEKISQFFREVRVELRKVNWPSRQETMASTVVVIVLVFLVSTYLGLVDIGLSRLIKYILG